MSCESCEVRSDCPDAFHPHAVGCNNYNKKKDNMKVKYGKIIEATNEELYSFWLKRWSDIYSYTDYKNIVKELGTKVVEDDRD